MPFGPVLSVLGFLFCAYNMFGLDTVTWVVFGFWMAAGLVFYFLYGYRRSRLATLGVAADEALATPEVK
ncbi:amino acid permease C-terminal domain-containing protein [Streptomyces ipomoeae]|uniref:Amino acid permease family protein n=2 Tax=Streptomyces ipomoeae TaxID=103232 RepID=L1KJI7_9ACTN|nr:amino acid permease C-terminal domain-containing protein [Streptomyces ipomoeae]EKX60976.1 amino acid permease family protein [Streptomyces ipomoeae 91-03]MDX2695920.1 amino acid permease C-terminal domain-containing protein [Streptomyces ipomoeae]MDX2841745.1 amino acid permease C-terminal domain-containing protein [Streptomyces ipomoeae]